VTQELLVAGGGIAGLSAAIGARRAGWEARLFEQAAQFAEVGAGLQLGPNATRILREWGVLSMPGLQAFRPARLSVRDAADGRELGSLSLGDAIERRYGAPYLTVHRADLHAVLLEAATAAGARLHAGQRLVSASSAEALVSARTARGLSVEAEALAIADGVWSELREQLLGDGPAPATGHLAYRALLPRAGLPSHLRSDEVRAWLGPRMHLVSYPVRGGEALNVVGFVEGTLAQSAIGWDHAADRHDFRAAAGPLCQELNALLDAVASWRLWPVHDRPPMRGAAEMAQGRAALLGDAAHPMRPYLAQGAGMAIEDARELQRALQPCDGRLIDVPLALRRYALSRWERGARVQARARRNGRIFHADGPLRLGRNLAMRAAGERLLDLPWLYG
jgi:salicylate hydroxylase